MVTNYNKGYCAICAKAANDWRESVRGVRVWVCDDHTCIKTLEQELRNERECSGGGDNGYYG